MLIPVFTYRDFTTNAIHESLDKSPFVSVYNLDGRISGEPDSFARFIYQFDPTGFCVHLNNKNGEGENLSGIQAITDALISISFSPGYFRAEPDSFLLFSGGLSNHDRQFIEDAFLLQGYKKVMFRDAEKDLESYLYPTGENLADWYRHVLEKAGIDDYIVIRETPSVEMIRIINEVEVTLASSAPERFRLLSNADHLRKRFTKLLFESDLTAERFESLARYSSGDNRLITGKRQAAEVAEFYKYEYEILPGWYKKLGHILKVISGRRTLRSLFNDNVKKYRL